MISIHEIETGNLTVEQLQEQITVRENLINQMVGSLYPDVVQGEIHTIRHLISIRSLKPIDGFNDKTGYAFLSNFYHSPMIFQSKVWNTVEHLFQASKTLNVEQQEAIRLAQTPGQAKKLGRKVTLRLDWENRKLNVMETCIALKFKNDNSQITQMLLDTGDALLVEGNWWHDNIWGDCHCKKCLNIEGKNYLGKCLMHRRETIRNERL